mgnify:CR=1 FL=1
MCQRYFQKSYNQGTAPATATTVGALRFVPATGGGEAAPIVMLPVTLRATPTLAFYSPNTGTAAKAYNYSTSADVTQSGVNNSGMRGWSGSTGFTANQIIGYHYTASAEL